MKNNFFIILAFIWGGKILSCHASTLPSDLMDVEEKESYLTSPQQMLDPLQDYKAASSDFSPLSLDAEHAFKSIHKIHDKIKNGYAEAKRHKLYKAYHVFGQLDLPDQVWEAYATLSKIDLWPARTTWKECVGAHLFFPSQVLEWLDCPYKKHLIKRLDIVWGLAISAKLNHSLGKYLLADALYKIRESHHWKGIPILTPFFQEYRRDAVKELKQCVHHPDACYLLGQGLITKDFFYSLSRLDNTLSAYDLFSRHSNHYSNHLRNKYYALRTSIVQTPTAKTYLKIARRGYLPAYLEASRLIDDPQQKEIILKEAAQKKYGPAFLKLGYFFYNEKEEDEQALSFFRQAAEEHGMATGYVILGNLKVGDLSDHKNISEEETQHLTEEAAEFFKKATEVKDPKGWKCLISLWKERYDAAKAQKDTDKIKLYWDKLASAIQYGMQIGSAYAYYQAQSYFNEEFFLSCISAYGYPPQGDIRMNGDDFNAIPELLKSQGEVIEEFLTSEG